MDTLGNKDARTRQLLSLVKVRAEQQSSRVAERVAVPIASEPGQFWLVSVSLYRRPARAEQQSSRAGDRANSKRARAISLGFGVVVPKARA